MKRVLNNKQEEIIEKVQCNLDKLTYAQQVLLGSVRTIGKEDDFQDLHWDDVYSVYYDNIGK